METPLLLNCPHCQQMIEVIELNCRIFRCGVFKDTYKQIDPHLPKPACDKLVNQCKIYGCGKPFRVVDSLDSESKYKTEDCDYI